MFPRRLVSEKLLELFMNKSTILFVLFTCHVSLKINSKNRFLMSTIFDVKFFDEIEDFFLTKMPRTIPKAFLLYLSVKFQVETLKYY